MRWVLSDPHPARSRFERKIVRYLPPHLRTYALVTPPNSTAPGYRHSSFNNPTRQCTLYSRG